jgi:hypothetical protein
MGFGEGGVQAKALELALGLEGTGSTKALETDLVVV